MILVGAWHDDNTDTVSPPLWGAIYSGIAMRPQCCETLYTLIALKRICCGQDVLQRLHLFCDAVMEASLYEATPHDS